MKGKDNIILCDFQPDENWNFLKGLTNKTKLEWKTIINVSNGNISSIKRYFKYFFLSFKIFIHRKSYNNIIAWQQFFGLIYAFLCRFFHVKKVNQLYIMTFIYIPKKGIIGKIYYRFIKFIVTSKYIDKIFVFSSQEIKKYCNEFGVNDSKFSFVPLGDDIKPGDEIVDFEPDFIFSSGFSNRDFDFLINTLIETKYVVRIYGKEDYNDKNIIMTKERVGKKLDSILKKCKLVLIPIKENREAGQLTLLHAMQAGIPVIATDTDCMKEYIKDGYNGFTCPNIKEKWLEKIDLLYNDEELYLQMSKNCKQIYETKHTLISFGENIGEIINKYLETIYKN